MLQVKKEVAFDFESYMGAESPSGKATYRRIPHAVCMTWREAGTAEAHISTDFEEILNRAQDWLEDPHCLLWGIEAPFDVAQIVQLAWEVRGEDWSALVFQAFKEGRIRDIKAREKLNDIESGGLKGGYSMAAMVKRHFGQELSGKSDASAWRYRYGELDGYHWKEWPVEAVNYALGDADWTIELAQKTEPHTNEIFQSCMAWSLACTGTRGLRVDPEWTEEMMDWYEAQFHEANDILIEAEVVRPSTTTKSGWSRDMEKVKALYEDAWAIARQISDRPQEVREILTDGGDIATSAEALDALDEYGVIEKDFALFTDSKGQTHNLFRTLVNRSRAEKFISTYLEPLMEAAIDDQPICVYYNAIVNTTRTSASGPNIQNFPARVKAAEKGNPVNGPMIRGCFVPRAGHVFVTADYAAIELGALAQVMLNLGLPYSDLADAINRGDDLHLIVAAQCMGITYDEALATYQCYSREDEEKQAAEMAARGWDMSYLKLVAEWRQHSKIANYSFPAGASAGTFSRMAKLQGADIDEERAEFIRDAWFKAFREMSYWFNDIARREMWPGSGTYLVEGHGPRGQQEDWFARLCQGFSTACNFRFQALTACGAKFAGWKLHEACYVDETHPLYGVAFPAIFVHDEWVLEVVNTPEAIAAAQRHLVDIMVCAMKVFIPDVLVEAGEDERDADGNITGTKIGKVLDTRWSK